MADIKLLNPNSEVRLAILEEISQAHERRITDIEEFQREIIERIDQKIQQDAITHIQTERAIARAIATLEQLAENVKIISSVSERADRLATAHEAMYGLALKLIAGSATVVSALWAVFVYLKL